MTVSLSKRIEAAEAELVKTKDSLVEATDALEAAPDEEALLVEVEELTKSAEKQEKSLTALKKAEQVLAARAKPVEEGDDPAAPAVAPQLRKYKDPDLQPGDLIWKLATANLKAFVNKVSVEQVLTESYKNIPVLGEVNKMLIRRKSQIDPAMTNVDGWAQQLVRDDVRGYIDTLKDVSVAAALASRSQVLDFGNYNSITIPKRNPNASAYTEPAWVSEGSPIPLTKFDFGSTKINRYKLAAITTMTEEIAARSTPDLEGILREALREAHAEVLDAALLSNVAAKADVRPAGLLNGVTLTTGTAGGGEDAVRTDIINMLSAMTANKLGSRPVLIMNNLDRLAASMMTSALSEYLFRTELASGNLLGIPVIASANVPQHTLIMVDAAYLACAFGLPEFATSTVATLVESSADTSPPTMASTAAGAAGTAGEVGPGEGIPVGGAGRPLGAADAGYKVRSLFQTYSIALRMIAPTSWGFLQDNIVEASDDTSWT